jgi:2-dehydro-3-deoxyphosphogalactonate aldolase
MNELQQSLGRLPLIAILRGLRPDEALDIGRALVEAGFAALEVPLNSPDPFASIEILARELGTRALIGAGTVLRSEDVERVAKAGGRLVVMPHGDPAPIREAKRRGLLCVPGVATPTEAFAALDAGGDALKLFPAEMLPLPVVKAWRAVLPKDVWLMPVGGITPAAMVSYVAAGADGFGLGSALYRSGMRRATVAANAAGFVQAFAAARERS